MLATLRIKNFALVADLTLELQPGYNVITGETGAGKSILIGALNLVLGERADRTLIRAGCDASAVEAVFDVRSLQAPLARFLEDSGLDPCIDDQLVLKRVVSAAGANRQFVNGSPAPLTTLATLGQWLVDIHGPHDHQSLLHPARQRAILDAFGALQDLRGCFAALVRRRAQLEAGKAGIIVDERTWAQQIDLLRHQVNEIAAAGLHADEENGVEQDYARARNAARLLESVENGLALLAEEEDSLLSRAGMLGRILQELARLDPRAGDLTALHEQAVATLKELQSGLSRYRDRVELDPARLRQLEERLDLLHALKRKYGSTLAEVIAFGQEARRKLLQIERREVELERLTAALADLDAEIWRTGRELSAKRRQVIPRLCQAVRRHLADLGFKQCRFDIAIHSVADPPSAQGARLSQDGLDEIEFQFSPNVGEPLRPLRAIASSGEMARVMLGLKTVLAAEDEVPVLVFDEVDANVGGETANAVGDKMRQIAKRHQVLCLTHLAPVAAVAAAHYLVTKEVKAGRTLTQIRLLDQAERVTELARMLGGQSETARRHAAALIGAS